MYHDNTAVRQEIINACLWLQEKGFVFGTWGNISVKLDDGSLLITPSKLSYDLMKPEDLVLMAPDGRVLKGDRLPTSERELHRGIMNRRQDVRAIVHCHSPYAMAAAAADRGIPPISEEMCQLIGGEIPITPRFVASEKHVELGEIVTETIGDHNALLIRNHGSICCGASLEEAKICSQVVEKSAQMYLAICDRKQVVPIEDQWVKAGRKYYLEAYGRT